jgi:RHS repeat-associated protein
MRTVGKQPTSGEICPASRQTSRRVEARRRNPQVSYYRARYYDPTPGRFLSEDPIQYIGGINFYAYAGNMPTDATDPTGLDCRTWIFWVKCQQQGEPASIIAAEKAHEQQHVEDNKELVAAVGIVGLAIALNTPGVCERLERRGFAKEIPILQNRINGLKNKKCLTDDEKKELQLLEDELNAAIDMQNKPENAKVYCHSGHR